jgi:hypothetical protein
LRPKVLLEQFAASPDMGFAIGYVPFGGGLIHCIGGQLLQGFRLPKVSKLLAQPLGGWINGIRRWLVIEGYFLGWRGAFIGGKLGFLAIARLNSHN